MLKNLENLHILVYCSHKVRDIWILKFAVLNIATLSDSSYIRSMLCFSLNIAIIGLQKKDGRRPNPNDSVGSLVSWSWCG